MNEIEYAGFWIRVIAALIDTILMIIVFVPVLFLLGSVADVAIISSLAGVVFGIVIYVLPVIAIIAFWTFKSATPGKMILKLVIVDEKTGGTPTISQWVVRYVGYYVAMLPFFLGLAWVGIDKRKQGLHDKLSRTVVVKKPRGGVQSESTV